MQGAVRSCVIMQSPICSASEYMEELQRCIGDVSEKHGVWYTESYSDTEQKMTKEIRIQRCFKAFQGKWKGTKRGFKIVTKCRESEGEHTEYDQRVQFKGAVTIDHISFWHRIPFLMKPTPNNLKPTFCKQAPLVSINLSKTQSATTMLPNVSSFLYSVFLWCLTWYLTCALKMWERNVLFWNEVSLKRECK